MPEYQNEIHFHNIEGEERLIQNTAEKLYKIITNPKGALHT